MELVASRELFDGKLAVLDERKSVGAALKVSLHQQPIVGRVIGDENAQGAFETFGPHRPCWGDRGGRRLCELGRSPRR